jgi:hypothetical protein
MPDGCLRQADHRGLSGFDRRLRCPDHQNIQSGIFMRIRMGLASFAVTASLAAAGTGTAAAQTFQNNDFVTWSQVAWGGGESGVLAANFNSVFASTSDLMQIGIPGAAGYSIIWDDPANLVKYLPGTGAPGILTTDLLDPTESAAGSFGGEVATLTLNVAYSDAGVLKGNLDLPFGNLVLKGLGGDVAFANGLTVRQILADSNTVLGGGGLPSSQVTFLDFFGLINNIDMSFNGGPVSTFGQQNFVYPVTTTHGAPEMNASSAASALTLLLGGIAVLRRRGGAGG